MDDKPFVMSVDDESFIQEMIKDALKPHYVVVCASNGREALEWIASRPPALIILDVEMPVMDGYETCRAIKANDDYADIPVLFLSGKDLIEDRLMGLDAGGDDYLTKPFNMELLLSRVKSLLALADQRKQLRESLRFATATAMTTMSSMSELGMLLEGMKSFNTSENFEDLAQAIVASLAMFDLQGMAQLRWPAGVVTHTSRGSASPLDVSVITQMASMDRIVHFKSRMAINYPQVTLLATNIPTDPEHSGRLRDHLAMLAEAAAVRVDSIVKSLESSRRGAAIADMIERMSKTLTEIDDAQRHSRAAAGMAINATLEATEKALLSVALTEAQEEYVASTIRDGLEQVVAVQAGETDMQNKLSGLIDELKSAL